MNDENDILEKANTARRVAIILAENIYAYLGGERSKDDLKYAVDTLISEAYTKFFTHKYITKDFYKSEYINGFQDDLEGNVVDDTDDLIIIDGSDN